MLLLNCKEKWSSASTLLFSKVKDNSKKLQSGAATVRQVSDTEVEETARLNHKKQNPQCSGANSSNDNSKKLQSGAATVRQVTDTEVEETAKQNHKEQNQCAGANSSNDEMHLQSLKASK
ncbi:unnamed protein product [Porites evermanni]|uniref:Uncharacterized protein n=1 Tax=Porites evermanni TaxID=104178 RepID=A0ABN8S0W7_9CNID|nr:unnamed protein product [Porites evermanni]